MKIDNLYESEYVAEVHREIFDDDDDNVVLQENVKNIIKKEVSRYEGTQKPDIKAYTNPNDSKDSIFFVIEPNRFTMVQVYGNRIVEKKQLRSFGDVRQLADTLHAQGYSPIDTRTYIERNWKTWVRWITIGAVGIALAPALAVTLTAFGSMIASLSKYLIVIGVGGMLAYGAKKARQDVGTT